MRRAPRRRRAAGMAGCEAAASSQQLHQWQVDGSHWRLVDAIAVRKIPFTLVASPPLPEALSFSAAIIPDVPWIRAPCQIGGLFLWLRIFYPYLPTYPEPLTQRYMY